jgi:hypothetical protein
MGFSKGFDKGFDISFNKAFNLVKKIHEKTLNGDIQWEETEKEGIYQAAFPNYSVRIHAALSGQHEDYPWDYTLSIFNGEGKLVEDITDTDLLRDHSDSYTLMQELYRAARSIAMGVETAIDDILTSLEH